MFTPPTTTSTDRPAVMVVSHERSGTHFLMNTLAKCYEYTSDPWIDLDHNHININYYYPAEISRVLLDMRTADPALLHVVKSHHQAEFFAGELGNITRRFVIFYIYRDPVAVMLSCWRFMHRWVYLEGPKIPDPVAFARAQPCGHMMRYQVRQHPSLLHRWAAHVEGWLALDGQPRVVLVRYEQLDGHFEETVRGFATVLGRQPRAFVRPSRDENVVAGGPEDPTGRGVKPDRDALRAACRELVGPTMARLGY